MKRRFRPLSLFALLLFVVFPSVAAAQEGCFNYDTEEVEMTGTISKKTFPGPPNYESIAKGDKPETYWVLHMNGPICTAANNDFEGESVTDFQMLLTTKQSALYNKLVGRKQVVTVKGTLSHATTGHHQTPVLVEVISIRSGR